MMVKEEPVIKACKESDNWTCVTFKPDLKRFGMETLEEDAVALMRKRVYDMAGIMGKTVKVRRKGGAARRGGDRADSFFFCSEIVDGLGLRKGRFASVWTCGYSLRSA